MLRALQIKKEKIRAKMSALWKKREDGQDWTPDEKKDYESHTEEVRKIDEDIKLRGEYVETFRQSKDKEDLNFDKSKRDASLFKIIRSQIYGQTKDESYKDDYGRVNEVLQETRSKAKHIKDGFTPVPESAFEKRTDITSANASGGSLVSEVVKPELYTEGLYEKTWVSECGVPVLKNLEGNVKIPAVNEKPSFGWVAENANFAEQDQTFKDVVLTPLYAGAIQIFSLGIFLRSQGESIVRFVQEELMRSFRAGIEKSFIQDDGSANTPRGLYDIIADYAPSGGSAGDNEVAVANDGGAISYAKCLEAEAKITGTNQSMPLKWLLSDKVRLLAQQVLKFAVNGASQLYDPKTMMLADSKSFVTNSIQDNLTQGSSANNTSKIVIFQPKSLVVGRWLGGIQLQVNSQAENLWKAGKTGVRILDVCNIVSRRDSDFAALKGIK